MKRWAVYMLMHHFRTVAVLAIVFGGSLGALITWRALDTGAWWVLVGSLLACSAAFVILVGRIREAMEKGDGCGRP